MKTLLLLRHGKAEPHGVRGDKARHLVEHGRWEAAEAGRKLAELLTEVGRLDAVVSSDAARAEETTDIAVASAGYAGEVTLEPDIYNAELDTLLEIVQGLSNKDNCVVIVGHNPGFEYLLASLARPSTSPTRLSTGALAHLQFEAGRWQEVHPGSGQLVAVYEPGE